MNFWYVGKSAVKSRRGNDHIHAGKPVTKLGRQAFHTTFTNTDDKGTWHHASPSPARIAKALTTEDAMAEPPRVP